MARMEIFKYLRDSGGSLDAAVNGVVTPVRFFFAPGRHAEIHRLIMHLDDLGAFNADDYGAVAGPLANGVTCKVTNVGGSTVILDLMDGEAAVSNVSWMQFTANSADRTFGAGQDYVTVAWDFIASGAPLTLYAGQEIEAIINDNLSTLETHRFMVQGKFIDPA